MKTKIYQDGSKVILEYDPGFPDEDKPRITRTFFIPGKAGATGAVGTWSRYVYEYAGADVKQVGTKLASYGPTLRSTDEKLIGLIRREYQAMRREEKRLAQWQA